MNLNLLLISRRLKTCFSWLCCQTPYSIHFFLQDHCIKYFFPQGKSRSHWLFPHWDDPFTMQCLSSCDNLLHNDPSPPVGKDQLSSPDSIRADWANCFGSKIFVPVLVFVFHALVTKYCETWLIGSFYIWAQGSSFHLWRGLHGLLLTPAVHQRHTYKPQFQGNG